MKNKKASQLWTQLSNTRTSFYDRIQEFARLTIPSLILPDYYRQDNDALNNDWSSIGSQSVNHLANKLMLTLFRPAQPFFRLDVDKKKLDAMDQKLQASIRQALSLAEQDSMKLMEQARIRSKLHNAVQHIIVTGNVLLRLNPSKLTSFSTQNAVNVYGLDRYVVKRARNGQVLHIIVKEMLTYVQLEQSVKEQLTRQYKEDENVCVYTHVYLVDDKYQEDTWVDEVKLGNDFSTTWTMDKNPWHVVTWMLPEGADYGIGHVEYNYSDLKGLSELSRSLVEGAILASEYRWLVNPGGVTDIDDVGSSRNGDTIPGVPGDINIVQAETLSQISAIQTVAQEYVRRLGRAFLMGSALTRDAERVTTEEIRMQANELETSLGGAYTNIAENLQTPIAWWLLRQSDLNFSGKDIKPIIITGLDALSRNSDMEKIRQFITEVANLSQVVSMPVIGQLIKFHALITEVAVSIGVDKDKYIVDEETAKQIQEMQMQQQQMQQAQQQQTM